MWVPIEVGLELADVVEPTDVSNSADERCGPDRAFDGKAINDVRVRVTRCRVRDLVDQVLTRVLEHRQLLDKPPLTPLMMC
jgi:hypothetical protein